MKIAAIIVTFNRCTLLQECIQSIRKQTYVDLSIIVINNGSTDETSEWLALQKDLIIINQENLGGAGGFFTGIKYACESGFEYCWLMDDDVIVDKNALQNLMKHSASVKGFLCSRVLDLNNQMCNVPKISLNKSLDTNECTWGNYLDKGLLKVDVSSFVSVLLPSTLPYEIGLPFKDFFIWGDDTEYTSRISRYYDSYMVIDSIVIHKRNIQKTLSIFSETDRNRIANYYFFYRNRILIQHSYIKKIIFFIYNHYQLLRLIFKGEFYKSFIICRGTWASLWFHPKTEFPKQC